MDTFHIIVLSVAVALLVLVLTVIGIMLTNRKTNLAYPPAYGTCPDYWAIGTDVSGCIIPSFQSSLNIGGLYNSSSGSLNSSVMATPGYGSKTDPVTNMVTNYINFADSGWTGVCNQKTWANQNNIVWDGVSNYNSC